MAKGPQYGLVVGVGGVDDDGQAPLEPVQVLVPVGQRAADDQELPEVLDSEGAAPAVGSGRVEGVVVQRRLPGRHGGQDRDGGAAGQPAQEGAGLLDVAERLQ